jgi:hypothetical protein
MKFCVMLGKSTAQTLEVQRETFEEHSSSGTEVLGWHSHLKAGRVPVECEISGEQTSAKRQRMLRKSRICSPNIKVNNEFYYGGLRRMKEELWLNHNLPLYHDKAPVRKSLKITEFVT